MVKSGFIFDVIVVQIELPNQKFEDENKVSVECNFHSQSLKITSSRIKVQNFRSGRSYEFDSDTEDLRKELEKTPLKLTLKYNNEVTGTAEMPWPELLTSKICEEMGEQTHVAECDIMKEKDSTTKEKIGTMEIIVRLQIKCQEMEDPIFRTGDDIRKNLDRVINPHDILFVVGKSAKGEEDCMGVLPDNPDDQFTTALDLSRYRSMNGQLVQTPDVLNTCLNAECCELKKISCEYQKIIEALSGGGGGGYAPRQERRCCRAPSHCRDCPHQPNYSESGSNSNGGSSDIKLPPCTCFATQHNTDDGAFWGEKLISLCPNDSAPKLMQTQYNMPRCCPVCKENLNWLPKLACCPKCGYKPVPVVEERPYNHKMTANQILQEYLRKQSSETINSSSDGQNENCDAVKPSEEQKQCRCTCKPGGKPCAHCRIRKLCEDIFQSEHRGDNASDDCGKCEPNDSEAFNICRSSSKDCRPYLARVFSELRDLYDIKEPKQKSFVADPRCEKELHVDKKKSRPKETKHISDPPAIAVGHEKPNPKRNMEKQLVRQKSGQALDPNDFGYLVSQEEHHPIHQILNGHPVTTYTTSQKYVKEFTTDQTEEQPKRKRRRRRQKKSTDNNPTDIEMNLPKKGGKKKVYSYCSILRQRQKKAAHAVFVNGVPAGRKNVPPNMGWLWNTNTEAVRRGWKPGAIRRPIKEMMKYFLKDYPADTLLVSQYAYSKAKINTHRERKKEELVQKPTLHICKKNGEFYITLRPLKDADALKVCADPYLKMRPIQFKITKNPVMAEVRKLKRCIKQMGFSKCTCHKPVVECFCRSFLDKKRLEYQIGKECRKRNLPVCCDSLVLSDTTDSDVEFDFGVTPPAGVIKPERLNKPNLVNHGTQYVKDDWNLQPLFPKPPNKFMTLYNCAIGDRYDTSWLGEGGWDDWGGPGGWGSDGAGGWGPGGRGRGGRGTGPGGRGGFGGRGGRGGPGGRGGFRGIGGRGGVGGRGGIGGRGGVGGRGGRGGRGGPGRDGAEAARGRGGKGAKPYLGEGERTAEVVAAAKEAKKERLRALSEVPPPLLCMVDRRAKPLDPCNPFACCPRIC